MSFPMDASVLINFVHSADISAALLVQPPPRAISSFSQWLVVGDCMRVGCGGGYGEATTAADVVDLDLGFGALQECG